MEMFSEKRMQELLRDPKAVGNCGNQIDMFASDNKKMHMKK